MTPADRAVVKKALDYIRNPCVATLPTPDEQEHLARLANPPAVSVGSASLGSASSVPSVTFDEAMDAALITAEAPPVATPAKKRGRRT